MTGGLRGSQDYGAADRERSGGERLRPHHHGERSHEQDSPDVPVREQRLDHGDQHSGVVFLSDRAGRSGPDGRKLPLRRHLEQHPQEGRPLDVLREPLTEKNWRLYAARHYDNVQCIGEDEFEQDLKRFKYIKKALTRRAATGEICERLVLNHLIVLCNVFGPQHLVRLIYLKMSDQMHLIKPFLVLLQILPPRVFNVAGRDWETDETPMDQGIVDALRRI